MPHCMRHAGRTSLIIWSGCCGSSGYLPWRKSGTGQATRKSRRLGPRSCAYYSFCCLRETISEAWGQEKIAGDPNESPAQCVVDGLLKVSQVHQW